MLTRASAPIVLACSAVLLTSAAAHADAKPPVITVTGDNHPGVIDTSVTAPGTLGAHGHSAGGHRPRTGPVVTCAWEQLDGTSLGLGLPGGNWYDVTCSDGRSFKRVFVPTASPVVPVDVTRARGLAEQARSQLRLPAPAAAHNPRGPALVGLPTWWWVDRAQWRPLRQRTQAGPVWAQVTATPIRTSWDAGDGSQPVVCDGPGRAYDNSVPETAQSTDCSYIFRRSSADQPQVGPDANDRLFTVTVTSTWRVSWVGVAGSGGTLAPLTISRSFPLAVAQRQTVVTSGSG